LRQLINKSKRISWILIELLQRVINQQQIVKIK